MSNYTLTALDTTGIQRYLFSTNNLRQNAGASHLVAQATGKWVEQALPSPHNVIDLADWQEPLDKKKTIDLDQLAAEVIYAGGGNVMVLFADKSAAIEFTKRLTQRVMLEAPGLQLIVVHRHGIDWINNAHALGGPDGQVKQILDQLAAQKRKHALSLPTLGLGVTAKCVFTGLPATAYDKDNRPISTESMAKIKAEQASYNRLMQVTGLDQHEIYDVPRDFEQLGSSRDESSYIAVVHADGNHMGKRIAALRDKFPTAAQNRAYIDTMRDFSLTVQQVAVKALRQTIQFLTVRINVNVDPENRLRKVYRIGNPDNSLQLHIDKVSHKPMLPFRPIVFGGDDLTFICDGRLGLSLTTYYLRTFSQHVLPDDNTHAHCRAGVAVVHTHYPFARAYTLAEDLCGSARQAIKIWEADTFEDGVTALDWHFATGGLIRGLRETRRHEYTSKVGLTDASRSSKRDGDLLMRPVRLNDPALDWRSWATFRAVLSELDGEAWRNRRNKLKALRDVLREGAPEAVEQFLLAYELPPLPKIPGYPSMSQQGWQSNHCGYFDAIEALDTFIDLKALPATATKEVTP